ncbi:MAG: Rrf2 family transcriptional regulator [Sphingomonas hengshuiensis]|nr:MAG: Rrf2 family transcriptional regulator [Sphingomonas hengshuiensis]
MLTQRSRYALRAMLYLAQVPTGGRPTSMTRIAEAANVPRKFLELILADLRVIEGPLALVPCVSRTAYRRCADCADEADCAIRQAMARVRDETARILDGTSLADAIAEDLAAA